MLPKQTSSPLQCQVDGLKIECDRRMPRDQSAGSLPRRTEDWMLGFGGPNQWIRTIEANHLPRVIASGLEKRVIAKPLCAGELLPIHQTIRKLSKMRQYSMMRQIHWKHHVSMCTCRHVAAFLALPDCFGISQRQQPRPCQTNLAVIEAAVRLPHRLMLVARLQT